MTTKHLWTIILVAYLILICGTPVFAAAVAEIPPHVDSSDDQPAPPATLPDEIQPPAATLSEPLLPTESNDVSTAEKLSFYASITVKGQGFQLSAYFPDYPVGSTPNQWPEEWLGNAPEYQDMDWPENWGAKWYPIKDVAPYYSFDGVDYQPVDSLGSNPVIKNPYFDDGLQLASATISHQAAEPLKSYLAGEQESFYIKLCYNLDDILCETEPYHFIRPENALPLPDNITVSASFPSNMRMREGLDPPFGQYCLTIRDGATIDEIYAQLPTVLPIEVQLMGNGFITSTNINYGVEWKLPDTIPPDGVMINPITWLIPPENMVIDTFNEYYSIENPPEVMMQCRLRLTTVPAQDALTQGPCSLSLQENSNLCVSFPAKPSGAQRIDTAYSLDGGDTWSELIDLLSCNIPVDAFPKNLEYPWVTVFNRDESPYKEFLAQELDGFLVRVEVTGGVLDGESTVLAWPQEYGYEPPPKPSKPNGSGGNEGNAGSGGGANGDSAINGGLHPNMPINGLLSPESGFAGSGTPIVPPSALAGQGTVETSPSPAVEADDSIPAWTPTQTAPHEPGTYAPVSHASPQGLPPAASAAILVGGTSAVVLVVTGKGQWLLKALQRLFIK